MKFTRTDYQSQLEQLRASRNPERRAKGDNFAFEENIGTDRIADFEIFAAPDPELLPAAAEYFWSSVQGAERNHVPSTFQPINMPALLAPSIARNQKLVRLEQIDDALIKAGNLYGFTILDEAVAARNLADIDPLIRAFNSYPGARPAYACCKSEIAPDLAEPDWVWRFMARLGLGHYALADGQVGHFALMEYTVDDVFRQTSLAQPFAVPTVLEARNSEFFFPAPNGVGYGYTVDLDHVATRPAVREILHIRLDYRPAHVVKVARLVGPTPGVHLVSTRDAHLGRVRVVSGRANYGEMMQGKVD